jgi:hypothetical protein
MQKKLKIKTKIKQTNLMIYQIGSLTTHRITSAFKTMIWFPSLQWDISFLILVFIVMFPYTHIVYPEETHPLYHLSSSSLPSSWNKFNRFCCTIFMHLYKIPWLYSSLTLFLYPSPAPICTHSQTVQLYILIIHF